MFFDKLRSPSSRLYAKITQNECDDRVAYTFYIIQKLKFRLSSLRFWLRHDNHLKITVLYFESSRISSKIQKIHSQYFDKQLQDYRYDVSCNCLSLLSGCGLKSPTRPPRDGTRPPARRLPDLEARPHPVHVGSAAVARMTIAVHSAETRRARHGAQPVPGADGYEGWVQLEEGELGVVGA